MRRHLALVLALTIPQASRASDGIVPFAAVSLGSRTRGFELGVGSAFSDMAKRNYAMSVEVLEAKETRQHEGRFHYEPYITKPIGESNVLFAKFGPMLTFGGITGTGGGLRGQLGIFNNRAMLSASVYASSVWGRENPWNGSRSSSEAGIQLKWGF